MNSSMTDAEAPPAGDILIVDDTPANLRLLSDMLVKQGYKVRMAPDGSLALISAQAIPPDLILLDIKMPNMSGYEVCAQLKADPRTRDIPVIFISALDQTEDKIKAFTLGGVDYVTKPFQVEEVLARVETHLALRNMQRELERKNAQLEQEIAQREQAQRMLQQSNSALALLNRVSQELTITLESRQAITKTLEAVTKIVNAQDTSVWLWDAQEDWLVRQAIVNNQPDDLTYLRLAPGQGIAGWVVQTGESVIVADARSDQRFSTGIDEQTGFYTTTLLAVPLRVRGKVIGALETVNKLDQDSSGSLISFDANDQALVETLASSAAIAIDNARLVEALHRRTAELQARNEDLDAYAHIVAHDLKGPLGHIVGFARVLELDHAELPAEEISRYLHIIAQSGRKMSNIIDELLLMAGLRQAEIELTPLDIASVVDEALKRLAYMIEEHQAQVVLPATWPAALGHSAWVEEVWVNYLSNALKYGGEPPHVELDAEEQADGMVRFWVRDNGPGLTPAEQRRLFKSFERLDQKRAKGHGLGLSIVQRIVEKLGGKVGIESQVGQGSMFWFVLPGVE